MNSSTAQRRRIGSIVAKRGTNAGNGSGNGTDSSRSNIVVAVRVRPKNDRESNSRDVVKVCDSKMLVFDPKDADGDEDDDFYFKGKKRNLGVRRDVNKRQKRDAKFAFDHVFDTDATNTDVFEATSKNLVEEVLFEGFNCSVFVYGATGAGKTFTMLGTDSDPGVAYRTVVRLYERIEEKANDEDDEEEDVDCEVIVSYLEVYNETVRDLLEPERGQLNNRESEGGQCVIPGLSMHKPDGAQDLLRILQTGNANRTQHPTDVNAESSRSHAVFQVYLRQKSKNSGLCGQMKTSKLSLIDLAGSERGSAAMSRGADRLREGKNINQSLLALGSCINGLAMGSKHIPYRNSKLTRLLKDSIGGNCRTVMISNVSPSSMSFEDTFNTLKYADRAKKIKIETTKNVSKFEFHVSQYAKIVADLKAENVSLKEDKSSLRNTVKELEATIETLEADKGTLREQFEELEAKLKSIEEEKQSQSPPPMKREIRSPRLVNSKDNEQTAQHELEVENANLRNIVATLETKLQESSSKSESATANGLTSTTSGVSMSRIASLEQKRKLLFVAHEFAKKIPARARLISLEAGINSKIEKHVRTLKRKLDKAHKKVKRAKADEHQVITSNVSV